MNPDLSTLAFFLLKVGFKASQGCWDRRNSWRMFESQLQFWKQGQRSLNTNVPRLCSRAEPGINRQITPWRVQQAAYKSATGSEPSSRLYFFLWVPSGLYREPVSHLGQQGRGRGEKSSWNYGVLPALITCPPFNQSIARKMWFSHQFWAMIPFKDNVYKLRVGGKYIWVPFPVRVE